VTSKGILEDYEFDEKGSENSIAMKLTIVTLLTLVGSLVPAPALAQAKKVKDIKTFSFYLENDTFADTDREYTSGVRLTLISPDLTHYPENPRLPEWSYPVIGKLPFVNQPTFSFLGHITVSIITGDKLTSIILGRILI
jgi:hypothetical protein